MKKALHKDFRMEVRKSKSRFVSIFLIVSLGVAFYSGIQASDPGMRRSADTLYDDMNLMDIKVVGTMGLTDKDVEALASLEEIALAEGAWSTDVLCGEETSARVLHVESLNAFMNTPILKEGRLPEKSGECFMDEKCAAANGYKVGDIIHLKQEDDSELLLKEEYTLVGIGNSPLYISTSRGNSTVGSGEVAGFLYVLPEDFDQEVYTQIYLRVNGAEEKTVYTEGYDDLLEKVLEIVEAQEGIHCQVRYDDVVSEARSELDDAWEEYNEEKTKAKKELAEAYLELRLGEQEIYDGKVEIEDGEKQLADAKIKIADSKKELEDGRAEIADGWIQLADAKKEVEDGWQELFDGQAEVDDGLKQLEEAQKEIDDGWKEIQEAQAELDDGLKQLEDAQADIDAGWTQIYTNQADIDAGWAELNNAEQELITGQEQLEEAQAEIDAGWAELNAGQEKMDAGWSEIETSQAEIDAGWAEANAGQEEINAGLAEIETGQADIDAGWAQIYAGQAEIDAGWSEINAGQAELDAGRAQLEAAQEDVNAGWAQIYANQAEIDAGWAQVQAGQEEINAGLAGIEAGQAEIDAGRTQLEAGQAEITAGYEQLNAAQAELDAGLVQITASQTEINDELEALNTAQSQLDASLIELNASKGAVEVGKEEAATERELLAAEQAEQDLAVEQLNSDKAALTATVAALNEEKATCQESLNALAAVEENLAAQKILLDEAITNLNAKQTEYEAAVTSGTYTSEELEVMYTELENFRTEVTSQQQAYDETYQDTIDKKAALEKILVDIEDGFLIVAEEEVKLQTKEEELTEIQAGIDASLKILEEKEAELAATESVIAENEKVLAENQAVITAGMEKINAAQLELDNHRTLLEATQIELDNHKASLNAAQAEIDSNKIILDTSQAEIDTNKAVLEASQIELNAVKEELASGQTELENGKAELNAAQAEIDDNKAILETSQTELDAGKAELISAQQEIDTNKALLSASQAELDAGKAELESAQAELDSAVDALIAGQAELDAGKAELIAGQEEIDKNRQKLLEGQSEVDAGMADLEAGRAELEKGKADLIAGQSELNAGKAELESAQSEVDENRQKLTDGQIELDEGKADLESAQAEVDENRQKLIDAQAEIDENKTLLLDAAAEIAVNENDLKEAEQDILEGEQELLDGWKEYEEGKAEAEEEFAEAESELNDAQEEINEIEIPQWYVTDRNDLPEHADYGDNARRIKSLGSVFPVIFFLVAALISLTTMTRMVEDQRTLIGTMKALGYKKKDIAFKYVAYAFLATLGGSIFGVLAGEMIIPFVIIKAYGIVYKDIADSIRLGYEFRYALTASGAALVCTVGATLFSINRALAETPASLMRPPAPKEGKRVLIERISFFWNRLNFSWKSSLRNMFRYKKRLIMTIFGIAGSMALMLVGFGIRDSILGIAELQYTELQHYDGMIIHDDGSSEEERQELIEYLENNEDIAAYTRMQMTVMEFKTGKSRINIYVYVPEDLEVFKQDITLKDRETDEIFELTDKGAAISEKTAAMLDLEIGDDITIVNDNEEFTAPVAVVTENYMGHYIYMTEALYKQTFHESPDFADMTFTVKEDAKDDIEAIGNEILKYDAALSITYTESIAAQIERMLGALISVIAVLIISAGLLAFVVLYNLNNINITERQRELATLKVLGFYDGEVSQYVFRENIVLTIVGIFAGAIGGIVLHRFVILTVEVDTIMFGRNIDVPSFLICGFFTALFSMIVNWVMHHKLKKIDMVESLKSVE